MKRKNIFSVGGLLLCIVSHTCLEAAKRFCLITPPKAGTNLVSEILRQATGKRRKKVSDRDDLLYLPPARPLVEIALLDDYFPGAHAFYRDELYKALVEAGVVIIFVVRDPRDMIVSFARFRKRIGFFGRTITANIPIDTLISDFILCPSKWMSLPGQPYHEVISKIATNAKAFYESYLGWKEREGVLVLRYEDLLGGQEGSLEKRKNILQNLFRFIDCDVDHDKIREIAENIDSMKVATFTPGKKIGRWEQFFTPEHHRQFCEVAQGLLEGFGYA